MAVGKQERNKSREHVRMRDCKACGALCCRHVALEIDKPTCKRDYDIIRWYLLHENVRVFIDNDRKWTLEFAAQCRNLTDDLQCADYEDRPKICRDYPAVNEQCDGEGNDTAHKVLFNDVHDFERYLERKDIDRRWKTTR